MNQDNNKPSFYAGIDAYMNFTDTFLFGLDTSFAIRSKNDTNESNKAGNRLDITPYVVWNINEKNRLSLCSPHTDMVAG